MSFRYANVFVMPRSELEEIAPSVEHDVQCDPANVPDDHVHDLLDDVVEDGLLVEVAVPGSLPGLGLLSCRQDAVKD